MLYNSIIVLLLAHCVTTFVLPNQEEPLALLSADNRNPTDILEALRAGKVIPHVLNTFSPLVSVGVKWPSAHASLGNTLPPSSLRHSPNIYINKIASAHVPRNIQLVLALTDPDAPSRHNPEWSQFCHWLVTAKNAKASELVEYKPPAPPERTGLHRYVFVVMVARNGTTERLTLAMPKQRKRWGYEGERSGVGEWARENGLKVIGANYVYAQNDKQ